MKSEKKRADELFSVAIIGGTMRCENSPCRSSQRGVLTPAHIVNRWHDRVRCDTRNAFCLCFDCHRYFEDNPFEFNRFVSESWAQPFMATLIAKSNVTLCQKTDWSERIEFLTDVAVGLKTLKQARAEEI